MSTSRLRKIHKVEQTKTTLILLTLKYALALAFIEVLRVIAICTKQELDKAITKGNKAITTVNKLYIKLKDLKIDIKVKDIKA
jgi:hypothetical protein